MKKSQKKDKKVQALITAEMYSRLTAIKNYYDASMNETITAALADFIKREERRIKKAQKNEKDPSISKTDKDEAPEEEWWEEKALSATDPLPPLSQIKYILEQSGNEDIDPRAARKRLDQDRRKNDLYSWAGWLKKTITGELREENEKKTVD